MNKSMVITGSKVTLVVAVILGLLLVAPIVYRGTAEEVVVQVDEKERIAESGSGRYLIFAEGEVFENTDSLFFLKFDSSDLYARIEEGQEYRLKVAGWRVRPLSMYRNVIEVIEDGTNNRDNN